jgi:hypothetical protein
MDDFNYNQSNLFRWLAIPMLLGIVWWQVLLDFLSCITQQDKS